MPFPSGRGTSQLQAGVGGASAPSVAAPSSWLHLVERWPWSSVRISPLVYLFIRSNVVYTGLLLLLGWRLWSQDVEHRYMTTMAALLVWACQHIMESCTISTQDDVVATQSSEPCASHPPISSQCTDAGQLINMPRRDRQVVHLVVTRHRYLPTSQVVCTWTSL